MAQEFYQRLRQDVTFVKVDNQRNSDYFYLLKHPESGEIFEFGREEYWLCKMLDSHLPYLEIIKIFTEEFKQEINLELIDNFYSQLAQLNLLEDYKSQQNNDISSELKDEDRIQERTNIRAPQENLADLSSQDSLNYRPDSSAKKERIKTDHFFLFNPEFLCQFLSPIFPLFRRLIWLLVLALLAALMIYLHNQFIFWHDLTSLVHPIPFLLRIGFSLALINFFSQITSGTVSTYYGGIIKELGVQLIFGFMPIFYIGSAHNKKFTRSEKLWIFASPLLFRLSVLTVGVFIWDLFRTTQVDVATFALILSQASFITFTLHITPFWRSHGYLWLSTYFGDSRFLERAFLVLRSKFSPHSLPIALSRTKMLGLELYAIFIVIIASFLMLAVGSFVAIFLVKNLKGSGFVIFVVLLILFLRWSFKMNLGFMRSIFKSKISRSTLNINGNYAEQKSNSSSFLSRTSLFIKKNYVQLGILLGILLLLCLPYKYRPGGSIKLLLPKQKEIQADISGKITKVPFKGGDGAKIEAGTIIAEIEPSRQLHLATPIDNDLLVKLEEINHQKANLEKAEARLAQLLATPRKEEIEVARRSLKVAQQELETAKSKLATAKQELVVSQSKLKEELVRLDFRQREVARLEILDEEGGISLQDFEDAQRLVELSKAEVETQKNDVQIQRQNIEEQKHNIQTQIKEIELKEADLALVMSGPHPDEIAAARQDVEAARAQTRRLKQELTYTEGQLQRRHLLMPFDGYLLTSYLEQKLGTYLEQGETFAVAEARGNIQGEIEVPESDAGEFSLGATTEIKLSAYPNQTIVGRVVSIEPITQEQSNGNFIKVTVEVPNSNRQLKSGMSGYAKIDGTVKPFFLVITRPLVRFIKIEVWSWIP
jgi:multidrug efflux pump subunit AcrA (membrane-fusion protein)